MEKLTRLAPKLAKKRPFNIFVDGSLSGDFCVVMVASMEQQHPIESRHDAIPQWT
jgi:hypothetical protein